jgi:GTP-binding protein
MSRLVAIIGRPNVGKSTLFNRLIGERRSIVEDIPGVTRDRIYGHCEHEEVAFDLVDTGGFDPNPDDALLKVMKDQVELALDEADAIIFLMDVRAGLNPVDEEIHRMISRGEKPVFHVVNKVDSPEKEAEGYEFYSLGAEGIYLISATHGRGVLALLDDVILAVKDLPLGAPLADDVPHIAVMGRPNVGKSTLINRLLGETRLLTSDVAGTTRDAIDVRLSTRDGKEYVLVDTAGMRRKRSITDAIEHFSVLRSIMGMERSHVVLLLLDARYGMEDQDVKIANLAEARGRGLIFLFNKWDLIEADGQTAQMFTKALRTRFPSYSHVPVLFTSSLTGRGVNKVLQAADRVKENWNRRITTGELNRFVEAALIRNPPPLHKHRPGRIYYSAQPQSGPPTFIFHVNRVEAFHETYRRYLLNQLREHYEFSGTPLRLFFRKRTSRSE